MRQIIATKNFDEAVKKLGGYRSIDAAMEPIIESLIHDPYGFPIFESDLVSFRYARVQRIGNDPPLVVIFQIDVNKNVILDHVEEDNFGY
ncbi:hypothetical protein [Roseibium sp. Sym1]|uniref:hypothetical protein n=1 Tax=Roseibium sp. Sym1 TaxID=3016006 RepID=UPI0022B2C8E0|nr:hypothetical protein [Roseibium sp. Sym1]